MAEEPTREELERRLRVLEEREAGRKRLEQELRVSEERYARAAKISRLGYWEGDFQAGTNTWSRELYTLFGLQPSEVPPSYQAFLERVHPDDRAMLRSRVRRAVREGESLDMEYRLIRPDGQLRFIHSIVEYLPDEQGRPWRSFGMIQDVTERRQTLEHLRLLSLAVDQSTEGMALVDLEGRLTFVNKAFAVMHGYSVRELKGRHLSIFHTPEQMPEVERANRAIRREGRFSGEIWHVHRDGTVFPSQMENSLVLDEAGEPVGMIATMRDVTEQKRAEKALREERDFSDRLIQSSPVFFAAIDRQGRVLMMNRTMLEALGYEKAEVPGLPYLETFVPEGERQDVRRVFDGLRDPGASSVSENRVLARDGRERLVQWHGRVVASESQGPEYLFGFGVDITQRSRMEQEIANVQRLEALGILAGGIAHDFNNILTAILSNLSMAMTFGKLEEDIAEMLRDAEKATMQARKLTSQLLTFAKGGKPITRPVSLASVLTDTVEFALSGSRSRSSVSIAGDLWPVDADEGQIAQVIQNLLINADQAMPRGGVIRLRAENTVLGDGDVPPLPAGDYVRVSVVDQGSGIASKDRPHIFDPFFTTKQKGSGLGLSTAFSIVRRHGGHIAVESRLEQGTSFHVFLPAARQEPAPAETRKSEPFRGRGRILIVDDDAVIRKSAGEMVRRLGYEVETAADHVRGIERYGQAQGEGRPFSAVLMDLTVPGSLDGREAVKRLLEIDPDARVIVSSGYAHDPVMSGFREHGFRGRVAKPYSVDELIETLREVLAPL